MADALSLAYLVKTTYKSLSLNKEGFDGTNAGSGSSGVSSGSSGDAANTPSSTPSSSSNSVPAPVVSVITPSATKINTTGGIIAGVFSLIFIIVFGSYAAYLSWRSNSLINWGTGWKIFFGFFAFLFGFNYLVSYLIFKADLVAYIRRSKGEII